MGVRRRELDRDDPSSPRDRDLGLTHVRELAGAEQSGEDKRRLQRLRRTRVLMIAVTGQHVADVLLDQDGVELARLD